MDELIGFFLELLFRIFWHSHRDNKNAAASAVDAYQITWQISDTADAFRTNGDFANRWLKL